MALPRTRGAAAWSSQPPAQDSLRPVGKTLLEFQNVVFAYRRRGRLILDGLTWRVPPGRTVLLGANGAGKSTVLGIGSGALAPRSGSLRWGGDPLRGSRRGGRQRLLESVGWMPQDVRALGGLAAREQVAYAGWLKGLSTKDAWARATDALDQVGLAPDQDRAAKALSGGQLRRLGLAEVLVAHPQVLLLDEPTVGLDPAQRARFREVLKNLGHDRPVVVSTHQVDDLDELFDTAVVIDRGEIRFAGSVTEFLGLGDGADTVRRAESAYLSVLPAAAR